MSKSSNGYGAGEENGTKVKEPETVIAAKNAFNQYFEMAGRKSFKQFYYDWHIDAMIEPFAELADYFSRRYPIDTAAHFDRFVRDFCDSVNTYNIDCEKFCSVKSGIRHKDKELSDIIDKIETFSFEFRQFSYSFMTEKDYVAEFGQWTFKPNYPYSHMHGLAVSVDILNKISEHYNSFENRSVAEKTRYVVDNYLRTNIASDYRYKARYSYSARKAAVRGFVSLRNRIMINVKIYCMKTHREYENVYMVIDDVLKRSRLEYHIERVTEPEELYRRRILFQPHIVINNRVVFARRCPLREEAEEILRKMKLIK